MRGLIVGRRRAVVTIIELLGAAGRDARRKRNANAATGGEPSRISAKEVTTKEG